MQHSYGKIQKKILLLLLAGFALGLTPSPNRQWRIIKELGKEWKKINRESLQQSIKALYRSRLISNKENSDGTTTILLNKQGKQLALTYNLETMSLSKDKRWDGKWRVVMFDIPERYKKTRDAFRFHLKHLGFFEYQKSVFVTPHKCAKEIEYLREFWHVKPHVRILLVDKLDNEAHLKSHFNL
ncbi:MAG: CRISPR-associated endonuclease Cas2 [bacterium]|nr:CRISPR-associated endonuclease Cas2 [bacterium]